MYKARALYRQYLLLTVFLIFPAGIAYADVEPPKNPNSAKACALCHYRWIDTFFIEGRGSDFVGYTSEKVVATPDMCFSCHDGSVADSRARAYHTGQHKTNVPPPAGMKIPEIFPLDEQGKMQCSTCHSAHGVPSGPDSAETIFMRTSNKDSAMCRMCHPDKMGGTAAGNHTMDADKEGIPRKLIAGYAKAGYKKNQMICETCHTAHGSSGQGLLVADNDDCGLCLSCHRDKSIVTAEGRKKSFHIINAIPKKVKIPETVMQRGAKLGSNGAIVCRTCHKVHNNKIERFLVIAEDRRSSLCLACHSDKQTIAGTRHNLGHSAPEEKNLDGKTVAQAGACSACHLPHKAARKIEAHFQPANGLCLSCHSKGNVAEKATLTGAQHPLNVYLSQNTNGQQSALPLFNDNGFQDKNGKIACATCHDPHRWDPLKNTREEHFKVSGNSQNSFLRIENAPAPKLCANCHPDQGIVEKTDHDLRITAVSSRNIDGQTPLESGTCGACHLVHNSRSKILLWSRGFGPGNNVMEMMCNSCHSENGPAKNKIPQAYLHPREKLIRNKERGKPGSPGYFPLFHGRSGKRVSVGNIACPSCHNVHQWNPKLPVRGRGINAEGDATNSFLRSNASFGLCKDCHDSDFRLRIKFYHDADKRKFRGIDDMFFQ